jgi:hypothetical protein
MERHFMSAMLRRDSEECQLAEPLRSLPGSFGFMIDVRGCRFAQPPATWL